MATTHAVSIVAETTVLRWCQWVEERAGQATVALAQQLVAWRPDIDPSGLAPPLGTPLRSFRTAHALIGTLRTTQRVLVGALAAPWSRKRWAHWALAEG